MNMFLDSIFSKLLKKRQIIRYSSLEGIVNDENQTYSLWYQATVNKTDNYTVSFLFTIYLPWCDKYFHRHTTSRKEVIYLTRNYLIENTDDIYTSLVNRLNSWRKGEEHERLFYNRFLQPLQKKYPELIKKVEKSSPEMDKHYGIDFTILFKPSGKKGIRRFDFNIKSSAMFLEEHHKKYPSVPSFIFTKSDLKDKGKLEERFLMCLFSSQEIAVTK